MFGHKLFRLNKHAAGTTAGVKYSAFVWFKHFHKKFNNTARSIELASLFSFSKGKFTEKVFKHMAKNIGTSGFRISKGNIANQVNKPAKTGRVKVSTGKYFRENIFQRWIVLFNGIHGVIDFFADGR